MMCCTSLQMTEARVAMALAHTTPPTAVILGWWMTSSAVERVVLLGTLCKSSLMAPSISTQEVEVQTVSNCGRMTPLITPRNDVTDINSGTGHSRPGAFFSTLVDDTIYFSATDGTTGVELWAYDTSNHSTWRVADINSGSQDSKPGEHLNLLVGDTIYFSADDGSTYVELWAHDTSNHSTWRVADINSVSQNSYPGEHLNLLVGDTIYFSADDGSSDVELWAHDTSNHSTWRVADICSVGSCNLAPAYGRPDGSAPGYNMQVLVGDTFYFDAFTSSTGVELWAHDTSNDSTWNVAEMTGDGKTSGQNQRCFLQHVANSRWRYALFLSARR